VGKKDLIRKTLAVGIIFLFIASTVTPAVISYDEPEEDDDYLENLAFMCYDGSGDDERYEYYKEQILKEHFDDDVEIVDKVTEPVKSPKASVLSDPMDSPQKRVDTMLMGGEWPKFHYDLQNTGHSTALYAPDNSDILWTYTTGLDVHSSAAIVNGKVYISAFDNNFYCLDADTGQKLWSYFDYGFAGCCPAVYDGKVYIASTYDYLYCLDADTGSLIWSFFKDYASSSSSPAVVDDKVYYAHSRGSGNASLYCLDADTGSQFWEYDMGFNEVSSPAIYNGKIYIGSQDRNLYCFDAEYGTLLWNFYMNGTVLSSPAIVDGKVYAGGGWYDGYTGKFYCLDAETGVEFWHYDSSTFSSPAVAYDKIYFVSNYDGILCLDADTGDLLWQYDIGSSYEHCFSSPAIADGKMYVGIWSNGKLICLDAYTGEFIWDYIVSPSSPGHLFSDPAVADGRIYMGGGISNKVYCFGLYSNPPEKPTMPNGPNVLTQYIEGSYSSTSTDPDGDKISYMWDWGDGTHSDWIGPYNSGTPCEASHSWTEPGDYEIRVKASDIYGTTSSCSEPAFISIIENFPPDQPTISGPTSGKPGRWYEFKFNAVDPEGFDVKFHIDWGDNGSGTTAFYPSGNDVLVKHIWYGNGIYTIRAKAEDRHGLNGSEATLEVTMPMNQHAYSFPLLQRLLERFPNAFPHHH